MIQYEFPTESGFSTISSEMNVILPNSYNRQIVDVHFLLTLTESFIDFSLDMIGLCPWSNKRLIDGQLTFLFFKCSLFIFFFSPMKFFWVEIFISLHKKDSRHYCLWTLPWRLYSIYELPMNCSIREGEERYYNLMYMTLDIAM